MKTLFLRPDTWDLVLDNNGNLAVADQTYAQAQDIASACRVFRGDQYYDQTVGIPYLEEILGKGRYSLALYRKYLEDAALSVSGVVSATVDFEMQSGRVVSGNVSFKNDQGHTGSLGL